MLEEFLGQKGHSCFRAESYGKAPCARPGVARSLSSLVNRETFAELALRTPAQDVLVVKNGRARPEAVPRSAVELQGLHRGGHSVALLNAHHLDAGLARVAATLGHELDASVAARVPARASHDDRYFTDEFQAMPLHGYTRMFETMLDHKNITLALDADYRDVGALLPRDDLHGAGRRLLRPPLREAALPLHQLPLRDARRRGLSTDPHRGGRLEGRAARRVADARSRGSGDDELSAMGEATRVEMPLASRWGPMQDVRGSRGPVDSSELVPSPPPLPRPSPHRHHPRDDQRQPTPASP